MGICVVGILQKIFTYLLPVGIILAAVLFAMNRSTEKSLFGFRYYTILTASMEPELSIGNMVFVRLADADEIEVGDVIILNPFSDSDAYLTHRVVEKIEDYEGCGVTCFRTKGDANDIEDGFLIDEDRVIGKMCFSVPKLGYVVRFVQLRWYFVIPLLVLVLIFFRLIRIYLQGDDAEPPDELETADVASRSEKFAE